MPEEQQDNRPLEPFYRNKKEAWEELKRRGYKIGHSKFYNHCGQKSGDPCKQEKNGTILESSLNKYIKHPRSRLTVKATPYDEITLKKALSELEKLQEQVAKLKLERGIMEGRFISREDFEIELASVIGQVQTGLHQMLEMRVPDWVALVGGDTGKIKDLLDTAKRSLDDRFNDFAKIDKFNVVFESAQNL